MTAKRRGSAHIEFPSALEIVLTREFDAPIELVFDVLTKPEHVIKTIAPYGEQVKVCTIDLRVGGNYHFVFVTDDGREMSFRGTFLEVDPPTRLCFSTTNGSIPESTAARAATSPPPPLPAMSRSTERSHRVVIATRT